MNLLDEMLGTFPMDEPNVMNVDTIEAMMDVNDNTKGFGKLQKAEEIVLEQPSDMDSSSKEDNENEGQVIGDHLEVNAPMELPEANARCEKELKIGNGPLVHEWCTQVIMNLLLSKAMQQVLHIHFYLLGIHVCKDGFQKIQETDMEEIDTYVLDYENPFADVVDEMFDTFPMQEWIPHDGLNEMVADSMEDI